MIRENKPWVTPVLEVLRRSKPEEMVLVGCKAFPNPTMGPATTVIRCGDGAYPACDVYAGCLTLASS